MKYIIITIISLLAIFQTGQAQSNLDELIAVPLSQPGERGMLEIGLVHGGIEVQGCFFHDHNVSGFLTHVEKCDLLTLFP